MRASGTGPSAGESANAPTGAPDVVGRSSPHSAVDEMVLNIRGLISSEGLKVGNNLPTERALCERFSSSRNTVREAMRILKAYGIVSVRPKVGAVLVDDRMERALDLFAFNTLELSRQTFADIQGFRGLLEVSSVELLFEKVNAADIADLRAANEELKRVDLALEASEADFRFHSRLIQIMGNKAMLDVYRIMKPVILRNIALDEAGYRKLPGVDADNSTLIEKSDLTFSLKLPGNSAETVFNAIEFKPSGEVGLCSGALRYIGIGLAGGPSEAARQAAGIQLSRLSGHAVVFRQ